MPRKKSEPVTRAEFSKELSEKTESLRSEFSKELTKNTESLRSEFSKELAENTESLRSEFSKELAKNTESLRSEFSKELTEKIESLRVELYEAISVQANRTDRLAAEIVQLKADVKEIREQMATKEDINRILNAIDAFTGRIETYDRKAVYQDAVLKDHEKRISDLEKKG